MNALLFIFLLLFAQEPVKKEAPEVKQEAPKIDMDKVIEQLKVQNQKADSVIATKNAMKIYNLDTTKTPKK